MVARRRHEAGRRDLPAARSSRRPGQLRRLVLSQRLRPALPGGPSGSSAVGPAYQPL